MCSFSAHLKKFSDFFEIFSYCLSRKDTFPRSLAIVFPCPDDTVFQCLNSLQIYTHLFFQMLFPYGESSAVAYPFPAQVLCNVEHSENNFKLQGIFSICSAAHICNSYSSMYSRTSCIQDAPR